MKRENLIDRLVTFALALLLVGAILAAYQVGSRSGMSSASSGTLAAGAAAQAGTGYISVPAAAFVPEHYLVDYDNDGNRLELATGYTGGASFFAPLHLPHGATVTKLTLNYYDNDADDGVSVSLHRGEGTTRALYYNVISNTDGVGSKSVDCSLDVDNSQYTYILQVHLDDTEPDLTFYRAIIEFTYPTTSLPLVMRNY